MRSQRLGLGCRSGFGPWWCLLSVLAGSQSHFRTLTSLGIYCYADFGSGNCKERPSMGTPSVGCRRSCFGNLCRCPVAASSAFGSFGYGQNFAAPVGLGQVASCQ